MPKKPVTYTLTVKNTSPTSMPMADLAELLKQLADVFGDRQGVHVVKIDEGSLAIRNQVDPDRLEAVEKSLASFKGRRPVAIETKPVDAVNAFLAQRNLSAELTRGRTKVLSFPGVVLPEIGPVTQEQRLHGEIIRIGGKDKTIHVHIRENSGEIRNCTCNKAVAKSLREFLFGDPVCLVGIAQRYRGQGLRGKWRLAHFRITRFERLQDIPLSEVFARARAAVAKTRNNETPEELQDPGEPS